ncbi:MAG: hypothetical protein GEV28_00330 [Actinophytocola sp.]|uniref:DUF7714 family protein n=1 Tax=Actinophytocola sp. TaxID=1872138 RepID=UPI001326B7E5|nr:hypothetical protein [Actinophytocola sp.]MPZ78916.1 hypothetical protein [Actinophytocola sp.]
MGEPSAAVNRMPVRYREVAVSTVDFALTASGLRGHFVGREAYRRTGYVVVHGRGQDEVALLQVETVSRAPLFSPITGVELLAGPEEAVYVHAPDVDLGVPCQVGRAARQHAPGVRCVIVQGRYEHVSFILDPDPIRVRLAEVAPPYPAKLLDQARRVLEVAEDLPPIVLEPQIFDLLELAAARPAERYLFPCRGSGIAPEGIEVFYLDERPPRHDWVLVGCERSRQIHQHFYGDLPPSIEMCPRELVRPGPNPILTKCCDLEEGVVQDGMTTVVPWGASLNEVHAGLRRLVAEHRDRHA